MSGERSPFSAAEQGLGYIYQVRFALLKILSLPESASILIEKEDDVEFTTESGVRSLASLKHKAVGDVLTDLSTDFWKSVRIWLSHYLENGRISSDTRFLLFTTAEISDSSFLKLFVDEQADSESRATAADDALQKSQSQIIGPIRTELEKLNEQELQDFYGRITIVRASPRITEIPEIVIDQHLRTIRRESRSFLFERLEGWWMDMIIKILSGERKDAIFGYEVSDKLSSLAEEYRSDNLPITFRNRLPDGNIDVEKDPRLFVEQLRVLELSAARIQNAIIDYYRAFEQRSSWARESLLISGEVEEYENKLVDEWVRYREVIFESIEDSSEDEACMAAGKELYRWAELETSSLRIRERVTESYVVRGTFHMLANARPGPMPFSLALLILPLCLHQESRDVLLQRNRSYFLKVVSSHPQLLVNFGRRATDLLPFTLEALGLLMQIGAFEVSPHGRLKAIPEGVRKSVIGTPESIACQRVARFLGKEFARIADRATIYTTLGIRP